MNKPYFNTREQIIKRTYDKEDVEHFGTEEMQDHPYLFEQNETHVEQRINNLLVLISFIIAAIFIALGLKLGYWTPLVNTGGIFSLFWLWQVLKWITSEKIVKLRLTILAILVFFLMCASVVYELLVIFGK